MSRNLVRTLHTLKHLKASQVAWRMRYAAMRRRPSLPKVGECRLRTGDVPVAPDLHVPCLAAPEVLTELRRGSLTLLDLARPFDPADPDWRLGRVSSDRLWTVTLHYHGWLRRLAELASSSDTRAEEAAALLRRLLTHWLEHCDIQREGAQWLAWNAYAIASRITHWAALLIHHRAALGEELHAAMTRSLARQARYLETHIEWDLRGNHLMRDAVGLVQAGRLFDGPDARRWLEIGSRLADDQAREQVLDDGGHFERSPMYHLSVMEDVLQLAVLVEDESVRQSLRLTWLKMAEFLRNVVHPDGGIAQFNDAGFNGAPTAAAMLDAGRRYLGLAPAAPPAVAARFVPSGLGVYRQGLWYMAFDMGSVGPAYQPGHAHAGTLGLELSYDGLRLLVDPGVGSYDAGDERAADRATASHNTLAIDHENSSDVWHIFRVGRRASVMAAEMTQTSDGAAFTAAHDGYSHLPGNIVHRRTVHVTAARHVLIADEVLGSGVHHVRTAFLLAPGWSVEKQHANRWVVVRGDRRVQIKIEPMHPMTLSVEPAVYHPGFHQSQPTHRLVAAADCELPMRITVTIRPV